MVTFCIFASSNIIVTMIVEFQDEDLKELIEKGKNNKYKKLSKDRKFIIQLVSVYNRLISVDNASELKVFSSLHYEKLRNNYSGKSSVRIANGRVERLIFEEFDGGIRIVLLELNEDHYGNK